MKKAFNRIFFTTFIFFIVFILYSVNKIDIKNYRPNSEINSNYIYTINEDNYISKTSVYVEKDLSIEDKIKDKLETMVKKNNRNMLLPSYFKPILPENTKINDVVVEDSIVKVYFSRELMDISKDQSEKMIEAIIYTVTDDNILGIEIYVDNNMLKYVPNTKKTLPTVLTRDFGINKIYEISGIDNITKVVMNYSAKDDNNNYYDVPVTKYVSGDRKKFEIIMEELNKISNNGLMSLTDEFKIEKYKFCNNMLKIYVDRDINYNSTLNLMKSIFNNYDINKIEIFYKNQKKVEKTKKDIEN